jgi:type II secretory pathway component PulF
MSKFTRPISPQSLPKNLLQIEIFPHISFEDKLLFTKHLAVMIKSGITLSEGVAIVQAQTNNRYFKEVLGKIEAQILNGQSLNESLALFPHIFEPLYIELIKIGEESGNLEKNLEYLAGELKKNHDFRNKVQGALMYPLIVLLTAIVVGGGIAVFVLPKLVDVFESLDVQLPWSTKFLLWLANLVRYQGIWLSLGGIAFFVVFRTAISTKQLKPLWQRFLFSLPVIGLTLQYVQMAQLTRNLGIMLKSGLPITGALTTQYQNTRNVVFQNYLKFIQTDVEQGKTIEQSVVRRKFAYFPLLASKMIGVGEKTGKLDESLLYLGDFFEEEVSDFAKNFSNVLEPIMLLVIGIIVAFVALSVISPIYQLTGSIHN